MQNKTEMTKEEKRRKVNSLRIVHPRFKTALELIKRCHESIKYSTDPQCMLITGPSGSGKTTVFDSYIQFNDKTVYEEHGGTQKKILWGEIPSPTRISTFLEAMLERLGDPFPTRGNIGNKNLRLVNLIKDCKVELIMLDEFQHFVHPEKQKINYEVADCFKSLVNRTKVPVVLFGLEESKHVLEANPQLQRRFSIHYSLYPFGNENQKREAEFKMLLKQIDDQLPFFKPAGLNSPDVSKKILYATGGRINSIMKIIREAAFIAIDEEKEQICMKELAKAYHLHSYSLRGVEHNPFLN